MDINIFEGMLERFSRSGQYEKIKADIRETIRLAIAENLAGAVPMGGESASPAERDTGTMSPERIAHLLNLPLSDEQLLGAYRVFFHDHANVALAHSLLSRRDVPARPPKWCFFALMDLPQRIDCLDLEAIKRYSSPMPIEFGAGDDIDFRVTVFGWAYDVYLSKVIRDTGRFEPECQEIFKKNVGPGDVVFDIGANIGCHTALFSHLARTGTVYAFEPVPANFRNLLLMVEENRLRNVELFNYAASSDNAPHVIHIAEKNIGGHSILGDDSAVTTDGERFINIECRRLDNEFGKLERLDFVKIDVEGHEAHVLAGMRELIEKHRPRLLHEFNPLAVAGSGKDPDELLQWLFSLYRHAYVPEFGQHYAEAEALSSALRERGGFVNIFFSTALPNL